MKKLFFTAAALLISTLAFSQGFGGGQGGSTDPAEMAKMQADRLKEQLELNQVQYDSLYVFYLKTNKENQVRREQMQQGGEQMGQGGFSEEMMEQFRKQREVQEAKIKSILTEAQYKKYQEQQAERQQRMGQGGGFGGGQAAPR